MKLKVDLDISSIKALALMKVDGMREILVDYNSNVYSCLSNLSEIHEISRYIVDNNAPSHLRDERFLNNLETIINDVDFLLNDDMRFYIWSGLAENFIEILGGVRSRCVAMGSETFDTTYFSSYKSYLDIQIPILAKEFNLVHSAIRKL